ncbi:helix-turn-helix domain-containing protein [Pseudomonas sp. C9]|uniref:helix-turn-helix domain-containing protein n=1 Tax=Pseudomonas sp. C9 TaxID=1311337 RepID=UPI0009C9695A|nr:hypothetical protein BMS17_22280 [Pseudomonas sp. C9]
MDIPNGTRNVTVKIPADQFRAMCPKIDAHCGRVDVANSRFVPLLTQFALQALVNSSCLSPEHVRSVERGLLELAFLMMDVPETDAAGDSRTVIDHFFHRVMAYIAANFHDADLAPERAAQARRVSIRYVHKVFQAHDTTFGRELRLARLRHAQKLLRENALHKARPTTIAEVAYKCGFSSQALFSVRFKEALDTHLETKKAISPMLAPIKWKALIASRQQAADFTEDKCQPNVPVRISDLIRAHRRLHRRNLKQTSTLEVWQAKQT